MTGYTLLYEAKELMCAMLLSLPHSKERRVITLINAASTYPGCSKYQIARVRMMLVDLYIVHHFYGSAWEQLQILKEECDSLPWKMKERMLERIRIETPDLFVYSIDQNIADPDLIYRRVARTQYVEENEKCLHSKTQKEVHGMQTSITSHGPEKKNTNVNGDSN